MKSVVVVSMSAATTMVALGAGIEDRTEAREFAGVNGGTFRYRWAEKTPAAAGEKVPLVFFFHGAGERGDNNVSQLHHGVPDIVAWLDKNESGFKLVAGQVPTGKLWVDVKWDSTSHTMPVEPSETMGLCLELMDELLKDPSVDTTRVYATGISMGGYGCWDVISRRPEVFAAAIPICGGADLAQATKLKDLPIYTCHGSKDTSVPVCRSRNMCSALWAVGSDVHYREFIDYPHNVWTETYKDNYVLTWFFSQRKEGASGGEGGGDSGGSGGGTTPPVTSTVTDLGDVRLASATQTLSAQSGSAVRQMASSFTLAAAAGGKGGLDRIVATGGTGKANAHLDINELVREDHAVLDIHAPINTLGCSAPGTAGGVNITCSNGVETVGTGAAGQITLPIVPWARGAASTLASDAAWTTLVAYDAEKGFRFLEPETEYETTSYPQEGVSPTTGANVRVTAAGVVDFAGSSQVNSFSMLSTAASQVYVTNGTMRIASGVLDLTSTVDNTTGVTGNFDFGEATGYITQYAAKKLTLAGTLAGSDVVIADNLLDASAGKGLFTIKSKGLYTGDLYVNGGNVTIAENSFVPSGDRKGNVHVNGKLFVDNPTINGLYGRGIIDKPYTGTKAFTVGDNDADGDFAGTILHTKGNYSFVKKGAGTQRFSGVVDVGGDFTVQAGKVVLTGTLTANKVTLAKGATFVVDAASRSTSAEPRQMITANNSLDGVVFEKGENVSEIELRNDGKELWATPKIGGLTISIY